MLRRDLREMRQQRPDDVAFGSAEATLPCTDHGEGDPQRAALWVLAMLDRQRYQCIDDRQHRVDELGNLPRILRRRSPNTPEHDERPILRLRIDFGQLVWHPVMAGDEPAAGLAHWPSEAGGDMKRVIGGAQPCVALECGDVGFDDEYVARV